MAPKALTAYIVVKKKVYPSPIIHLNQIAYTIITKDLLILLQKDKKKKESCHVVVLIRIGNNKEGIRSILTDADIDDTNAKVLGDMFLLASISMPLPAMKKVQNQFGLPPRPILPQDFNKVIIFNKGNSIPPILSSILTITFDSGGYPELALLDQRTFSTANGVLDEKLCHTLLVTGTPVYSEDGTQLYALLVPSKKSPLACFVINSNFYGQSKNINHEKSLEAPSEGSPVKDDNIKVETKEPKDEAFASCSKERRAPPNPPREILMRISPGATVFPPNHQKIEDGACAKVEGKDCEEFHSVDEETSSNKTERKFEEEGENEISASKAGTSFEKDSEKEGNCFSNNVEFISAFSVDGVFEQRQIEVDNYKAAYPTGDEQQSDKQYARQEPDSPRIMEENSPPDAAVTNLCGAYVNENEISQSNLDSGYNTPRSSRQIQTSSPGEKDFVFENHRVCSEPAAAEITDSVARISGEHQQADYQQQQPIIMIEANQQPDFEENHAVNIDEPIEPPPEGHERRSSISPNFPNRNDRVVSNMVQPSSLSEDNRPRNHCVPTTPTGSKGPWKFSFPRDCCHQLKEADFNQIQELSLRLDKGTLSKDGWYALSKQFDFISEQTRTQLNMAYCGGGCPALAYLLYMSTGSKQMNFSGLLDDCLKLEMSVLVKYMCENLSNSVTEKTLLCDLPYTMLQHIATELSPKPQQPRNLQKIWKNLAGLNKLHHWEVEAIENSQLQPGLSSPTEELMTFIPTVVPHFQLSYLAEGLIGINRVDLLTECSIFTQCFQNKCIARIE